MLIPLSNSHQAIMETAFVYHPLPFPGRAGLKVRTDSVRVLPRHMTHQTTSKIYPRAVLSPQTPKLEPSVPLDKAGQAVTTRIERNTMERSIESFIETMPGVWNSHRTYHYLTPPEAQPSQTTFTVEPLGVSQIEDVLARNSQETQNVQQWQTDSTRGFCVSFLTKMQGQPELVRASTNLAFVPHVYRTDGTIHGDYFRDLGYEEKGPIKAKYVFDCIKMSLTMTTVYTRVVSVDNITLVNPNLRIRNIVNYARPKYPMPLSEAVLVGFGVESRSKGDHLVA